MSILTQSMWDYDWIMPEWDGASPRIAHHGSDARLIVIVIFFGLWHSTGTSGLRLGHIQDVARVQASRPSGLPAGAPLSGALQPDGKGLPHPEQPGRCMVLTHEPNSPEGAQQQAEFVCGNIRD